MPKGRDINKKSKEIKKTKNRKKKKKKKNKKIEDGNFFNIKIAILFVMFLVALLVIIIAFFRLQIVEGKKWKAQAKQQQIKQEIIKPKREKILDRNGEILAQSISTESITINPGILRENLKKQDIYKEEVADVLSETFKLNKKEVIKKIESENNVEMIIRKQEEEKTKELKKWIKEKGIVGINIDSESKREYPYGRLAANLIGFCGTDHTGLEGLELSLNDILSPKNQKVMTIKDPYFNNLENIKKYISRETGDVYLTIDVKVQKILEKHLSAAYKRNRDDSAVAIAMQPKTGEILGIATYPTYDLNEPFMPIDMKKSEFNKLSSEEKQKKLQNMWKNRAVNDGYEPGSVFKVITASIGLEENKTVPDKYGDFLCTGIQRVAGTDIACWRYYDPHGKLSLRGAIKNSCNPAFIQLIQRIGKNTFYDYYEAFGFTEKTGVKFPGEDTGIIHNIENVGPVELAIMSFGQRFTVTPIQMATALSAVANGGYLNQPQIVKKVENPITKNQEITQTKTIRKVISEKTSKQMMDMMYTGCGINARIPGYKIAGKSGTSEPQPGREKIDGYVASFVSIVPADDPKIVVLVVQKHPRGFGYVDGGYISGIVAREIVRDLIPLMEIKKENEKPKLVEKKSEEVLNVKGKTVADAKRILQKQGFYVSTKTIINQTEAIVVDQVPKAGEKLEKDSKIYIYTKDNDLRVKVEVPDVIGKDLELAKSILRKNNLNYIVDKSKTGGKVSSQSIDAGEKIEQGSIVYLK